MPSPHVAAQLVLRLPGPARNDPERSACASRTADSHRQCRSTGDKVAIKIIEKKRQLQEDFRLESSEVEIHGR